MAWLLNSSSHQEQSKNSGSRNKSSSGSKSKNSKKGGNHNNSKKKSHSRQDSDNESTITTMSSRSQVGQELTSYLPRSWQKSPLLKHKKGTAAGSRYGGTRSDSATVKSGGNDNDDDDAPHVIGMDAAIEKLGNGPFQRRILIAAGLCFASDSMEVLLLSFLAVVLQAEWGLTDNQTDAITSSVFIGAMLGTLTLGPLGDRLGRKPVFTATAAIISLFGFLTAAATNYPTLLFIRFLVGFGVGGLTVPFDTLAEFVPTSHRGQNLMAIEYFWTGGTLLVPVLAYVSLGQMGGAGDGLNHNAWRWFVALCAIPCVVSTILGIMFVPESPRWLIAEGRHEKALKILRQAAARNGKDPMKVFPEGTLIKDDEGATEESSNFMDLFKPQWRKLTMNLFGTWAGFAFLYYGTIILVTLVFARLDDEEDTDNSKKNSSLYSFDYGAIFTSASAEIAGTTLVLVVIDRIGRVRSQVFAYIGGGFSVLLLCHLASQDDPSRTHLVTVAFLARMCFMAASCGAWVSTAEVLSTEVRTTGHAASNAVARLSGAFCPYVVNETMPYPVIGATMFIVSLITCGVVSRLPETTGKAMGSQNPGHLHEHMDDSDDSSDGIETKKLLV